MNKKIVLIIGLLFGLQSWAELTTVPNVDISRYLGQWQEVARFENKHQQGCVESSANYSQAKGYIKITNTCTLADGKKKMATGRAKFANENDHARLQVNFTPFFIRMFGAGWGDYWIIDLGTSYEYAVVSEPKMEYLWILSRNKPMKKAVYNDIVERLSARGFATQKLIVDKTAVVEN